MRRIARNSGVRSHVSGRKEMQPTYESIAARLSQHNVMSFENGMAWLCEGRNGEPPQFEAATWGGKLILTGDFGTWVFARRNTDMLRFFARPEVPEGHNLDYLREKLIASDVQYEVRQFSQQKYIDSIEEIRERKAECGRLTPEIEERLAEASSLTPFNDFDAFVTLADIDGGDGPFDTLEYTDEFRRACYAITWIARKVESMKCTE